MVILEAEFVYALMRLTFVFWTVVIINKWNLLVGIDYKLSSGIFCEVYVMFESLRFRWALLREHFVLFDLICFMKGWWGFVWMLMLFCLCYGENFMFVWCFVYYSLIATDNVDQMKDNKDGVKNDRISKSSSIGSLPLILDVDDFKVKVQDVLFIFLFLWSGLYIMRPG